MPRQNVRKKFPKQLEFAQTVPHTPGNYLPVCILPAHWSLKRAIFEVKSTILGEQDFIFMLYTKLI